MAPPTVRSAHLWPLAALLLVLLPAQAAAQAGGTIRGRVVDAATTRPLANAQVLLVGTNRTALANAAGEVLLLNVPAGTHTLRGTMLGYSDAEQQVQVTAGQVTQVTFELNISAFDLDEIVVTGTAGATTKRTLGNSITTLDAASITEQTAVTTLTELLQAKSPGVQILPNSGTLGAAADIRIRGAGSLTQTKPVVLVDGIRYNIEDLGSFTPSGAGMTSFTGQATSAFDFINPNDIESIEIVKGPAAATLYGAEAANGVIQIITKKGRVGEQPLRWTIRSELATNQWGVDIPDNYTTCTAARIAEVDAAGAPIWPGCQGVAPNTVLRGNPLRDDPAALRDGAVRKISISMRGGGERFGYFISGDLADQNGIFRNNYDDRKALRANFTLTPYEWFDLYVTTAFSRNDLRLPVGDEAAQGMLLSAFRGRPGRVTTDPLNAGWATTRAEQANDYNNTTRSDRLTLGATVNIAPFPWFRNRLTVGMDYTSSLAQVLSPPGSTDADYAGFASLGAVGQRVPRHYVYTFDYAGNLDRALTPDVTSTTSVGFQATQRKYEQLAASGTGLGAPDITLISAAANRDGTNSFSESKSLGLFVQEQLGWKNRLFLTGAIRADDNSSFGEAFDWIYYPKAQLSWVLSEEPALQGVLERARINNFKFRAAWGEAGQAPAPFSATQIYTVDRAVRPDGTVASALRVSSYGNPNLVAERGTEIEVGFDAGLLQDRVGVEFTYYNKRMEDVIVSVGPPASTGFGSTFYGSSGNILRNLGETLNSGLELGVYATPVQTPKLAWDVSLSLATNKNELVAFGDERPEMILNASYGAVQRHREGYPLAGYWYNRPLRDSNGDPVIYEQITGTDTTRYIVVTDDPQYLGPSVPTREISLANTFTLLRDFRLFVLFDYKGGHHLYNYKGFNRCAQNQNCELVNDAGRAGDPEAIAAGTPRSITETNAAENRAVSAGNPYGFWIEKADFIKLRDVSLTYTLPSEFAQAFRATAASVTVAGHNLGLWTDYSGLDPEVSGYGNRQFVRADVFPVPMLRRWSLSMNLSF